jgi:cardiolipin synthase
MYWFGSDRTGLVFRDALTAAARRGVKVRLVYDAIGSLGTDPAIWRPLVAAGGEVYEFAPVSPFRRRFRASRISFRDHRKILVVDRRVGFTGGLNLGDEWAPRDQGGDAWRDDAVEVRGRAAEELSALFYETFRRVAPALPRDAGRLDRHPGGRIVVLANQITHGRARGIRHAYLKAIRHSHRQIELTSPYFLPSPAFMLALARAARRGVKVRILIPEQGDVFVVSLAMAVMVGRLIEAGARVFAFQGRVLHAKTAVFDDEMAMTGSSNIDMRSWRYNRECNLAVYDPAFAAHVRSSFERDLTESIELSADSWRARPLWYRALAWFVFLFRQLL